MADTLNFELVSPERKLASVEAEMVTIPGMMGDLTAMANHAPFLTNMRPGFVVVRNGSSEDGYFVTGGFAEISSNTISVLAEDAGRRHPGPQAGGAAKAQRLQGAAGPGSRLSGKPFAGRIGACQRRALLHSDRDEAFPGLALRRAGFTPPFRHGNPLAEFTPPDIQARGFRVNRRTRQKPAHRYRA
jgi:F-type H+-transporting ATPase subunit epsilon